MMIERLQLLRNVGQFDSVATEGSVPAEGEMTP